MMERINTRAFENKKFKPSFDCLLNGRDRAVGDLHEAHLEGKNFQIEGKVLEDDEL